MLKFFCKYLHIYLMLKSPKTGSNLISDKKLEDFSIIFILLQTFLVLPLVFVPDKVCIVSLYNCLSYLTLEILFKITNIT